MNNYLNLVQENLHHHKMRSLQILNEEVQRGLISKKDFFQLTSVNKKEFEIIIKKEIKKLIDIYNKRYSKKYGKLTGSAIFFIYNPPSLIYTHVIIYRKGSSSYYIIQANTNYNLINQKFEKFDFYVFYESDGRNSEKIAEGNEKEEYTTKGKYGELLNIINPVKNLRNSKVVKYKLK